MEYVIMSLISFCTTFHGTNSDKVFGCKQELIRCVINADKGLILDGHKLCVRNYVEKELR